MAENEKSRCGDTVSKPQFRRWDNLWSIERQMRHRGRMECAIASALNLVATLYFTLLSDDKADVLAKLQEDPSIEHDIRCIEGLWL